MEQLRFKLVKELRVQDEEGRGWNWSLSTMILNHSQGLPLDTIDSILNRERKTATYKPAFLHALCDIALENQNLVIFESDRFLLILFSMFEEAAEIIAKRRGASILWNLSPLNLLIFLTDLQ